MNTRREGKTQEAQGAGKTVSQTATEVLSAHTPVPFCWSFQSRTTGSLLGWRLAHLATTIPLPCQMVHHEVRHCGISGSWAGRPPPPEMNMDAHNASPWVKRLLAACAALFRHRECNNGIMGSRCSPTSLGRMRCTSPLSISQLFSDLLPWTLRVNGSAALVLQKCHVVCSQPFNRRDRDYWVNFCQTLRRVRQALAFWRGEGGGGWRVLGGAPREEGEGRSGGLRRCCLLQGRRGGGAGVAPCGALGPSISAWDSRHQWVHCKAHHPWSTHSMSAFCVLAQDPCATVGNTGCLVPAWVTEAEACGCLVLSPASRTTLGMTCASWLLGTNAAESIG